MADEYLSNSNTLITELLKVIVESVKTEWDNIQIIATNEAEGVIDVKCTYTKNGQSIQFKTPPKAGLILLKYFKISSSPEKGIPKKAIFIINTDMKFEVKNEY